jgi:hypothetical protein
MVCREGDGVVPGATLTPNDGGSVARARGPLAQDPIGCGRGPQGARVASRGLAGRGGLGVHTRSADAARPERRAGAESTRTVPMGLSGRSHAAPGSESRANAGDLVMATAHGTAGPLHFMAREGGDLHYVPVTEERRRPGELPLTGSCPRKTPCASRSWCLLTPVTASPRVFSRPVARTTFEFGASAHQPA